MAVTFASEQSQPQAANELRWSNQRVGVCAAGREPRGRGRRSFWVCSEAHTDDTGRRGEFFQKSFRLVVARILKRRGYRGWGRPDSEERGSDCGWRSTFRVSSSEFWIGTDPLPDEARLRGQPSICDLDLADAPAIGFQPPEIALPESEILVLAFEFSSDAHFYRAMPQCRLAVHGVNPPLGA